VSKKDPTDGAESSPSQVARGTPLQWYSLPERKHTPSVLVTSSQPAADTFVDLTVEHPATI